MIQHAFSSASAALFLLVLIGPADAQEATCPSGAAPIGHLGFTVSCDCTVSVDRWPAHPWNFRSGIHVLEIEAGGPAAGKLERGDTIVAVDGHDVTTTTGARRFADLRPGERVKLAVRRGGRRLEVEIRTALICPLDPRALGAYAVPVRAAAEVPGAAPPSPGTTPGAESPEPIPITPDLRPPGRLGLALACRSCGWERNAGDRFPRWHSVTPPAVYSVEPDGPAARAGIRPGDVLLEVEGRAITSSEAGATLGAAVPGQELRLALARAGDRYETTLRVAEPQEGGVAPDRYTGSFGGVRVDVRSEAPALVRVSEDGGVMIIRVGGTEVRLTADTGQETAEPGGP